MYIWVCWCLNVHVVYIYIQLSLSVLFANECVFCNREFHPRVNLDKGRVHSFGPTISSVGIYKFYSCGTDVVYIYSIAFGWRLLRVGLSALLSGHI